MKDLNKTQELILFILDRANKKGIDNLSMFQLFKIAYLLQYFSKKYTGELIIPELSFIREKKDQYLSPYIKQEVN